MSLDEQIRQIAGEVAAHAQQREARLEREKLDLETKLAEKQAALNAAHLASDRFSNFPVTLGIDFLCPYCWIEDGKKSILRRSSGTTTHDFLDCDACGRQIEVFVGMP
jgi:predicted RNA-binding Zn-ribbon protein involved in translation (DUF1610 family)